MRFIFSVLDVDLVFLRIVLFRYTVRTLAVADLHSRCARVTALTRHMMCSRELDMFFRPQ